MNKMIRTGICLLVIVSIMIGALPLTAQAATQQQALEWVKNQEGKFYDIDGISGVQCSDFVSAYVNWLVCGDPYNTNNFTTYMGYNYWTAPYPANWEKIPNTASLVPQAGDILCFAAGKLSSTGHVAIAIEGCTTSYFNAIQQNGKEQGKGVYKVTNGTYFDDHKNFQGVIRPNWQQPPPPPSTTTITDVTKQFADKTVYLKSVKSGQYVCGESNSTIHAYGGCGSHNKGVYKTYYTSDGWIGFQLVSSGKWISVQNRDYLRTEGAKLSSWECFKIYQKGTDYYLLSQKNNSYVQMLNDESSKPLAAHRPKSDGLDGATWERFHIEEVTPSVPSSGGSPSNPPNNPSQPLPPSSSPTSVTNQPYNRANFDKGKYTGAWKNNAPHGYGTLIYDSDNKYKISYSGGDEYRASKYVGNWSNGQKSGNGIFTYTNGISYDGEWNVNGVYFYGYYIDGSGNKRKVKQTLQANGVTINSEWIGGWEKVNPTPAPTPAPKPTPTPAPSPEPARTNPELSGWTRIEDMPKNAEVSERKWTYSIATTFESTNNSVAGATKTGERWVKTGSGSREYAYFPGGFDTSHNIYNTYDKAPVAAYDNGFTKREVTDSHSSYIYWHWTYEPGSPTSSVDNRYIQSYKGYDSATRLNFIYFHAVVSGQDHPFVASANAHKWNGGGMYWTWWWYKLDLRRSDYVDYTKHYTYSQTQETESSSYPTGNGAANIQEWVKYTLPQQTATSAASIKQNEQTYTAEPEAGVSAAFEANNASTELDTETPTSHSTNTEISAERTIVLFTGYGGGFDKMYVEDEEIPIDDSGTTPIVRNDRTLLPIRAIIENLGGRVEWDGNQSSVKCWLNGHYVQLWIDSAIYYVDDFAGKATKNYQREFDVAPIIDNERTMIPIRGVLEALGCTVDWEQDGGGDGWNMITITSVTK